MEEPRAKGGVVRVASGFGKHLIGREIGNAIRRAHFSGEPKQWAQALDFSGVEQATESCVDELFAPLARAHGLDAVRAIRIEGASRPVRETVDYVLSILSAPPRPLTPEGLRHILDSSRKKSPRRVTPASRREDRRKPA